MSKSSNFHSILLATPCCHGSHGSSESAKVHQWLGSAASPRADIGETSIEVVGLAVHPIQGHPILWNLMKMIHMKLSYLMNLMNINDTSYEHLKLTNLDCRRDIFIGAASGKFCPWISGVPGSHKVLARRLRWNSLAVLKCCPLPQKFEENHHRIWQVDFFKVF